MPLPFIVAGIAALTAATSTTGIALGAGVIGAGVIGAGIASVSNKSISISDPASSPDLTTENERLRKLKIAKEKRKEREKNEILLIDNKILQFQKKWDMPLTSASTKNNIKIYFKEINDLIDDFKDQLPETVKDTTKNKKILDNKLKDIESSKKTLNTLLGDY